MESNINSKLKQQIELTTKLAYHLFLYSGQWFAIVLELDDKFDI